MTGYETVGGRCKLAIHGLDPGIPAGMTAKWVLPCVLIIAANTISGERGAQVRGRRQV
jgi:hypothetical protein